MILILGAFGVGFDLFLDGRPLNYPAEYPFHIQTETAELLIGIGSALYLWLNLRAFALKLPRTIIIESAQVKGKTLEMQTPDGLLITAPTSQYAWLGKADVPQGQNLRLTRGGSRILWLDLGIEHKVSHLLRMLLAPLPPSGKGNPSIKPIQVLIPISVGLISMFWLALIPGESQNAVLLGLSRTRLLMLAVGCGLLGWMGALFLRGRNDPAWRLMMTHRIDQIWAKPALLTGISWVAGVGVIGSTISLIAAYAHPDAAIQSILRRLAPFAFWALVITLEALLLAIPRLVAASRSELIRIADTRIFKDQLTIKTTSQVEVTLPISRYPLLDQASQDQRAAFSLTGSATRVEWPALGVEIQLQDLFRINHQEK